MNIGMRKQKLYLIPSLLFVILLIFVFLSNAQASDTRTNILQATNKEKNGEYVRNRFFKQMKKRFNQSDKRKKMLIIGDSHAQDFYNAMLENHLDRRFQIRTRRIPAICGLYLGSENIRGLIEKRHLSICDKADTLALALPQIKQSDVVIIAANWKLWSVQRLSVIVKNLRMQPTQKLFVIGRKTFGKLNLRHYLRLPDKEQLALRNPVYSLQQEINKTMKQQLTSGVFVNVQALLCQSDKDCPVFTPQVKLISFDGGHLTKEGAKYMGNVLLQKPPLNSLLMN